MSTKTRGKSMIATLIVFAVLSSAGVWAWDHYTTGSQRVRPGEERVDVIVQWSPSPRQKPVVWAILLDDIPVESGSQFKSPFQRTLVVPKGTVVKIGGQQQVDGTLICKARVYSTGKEMREDIFVAGTVRCAAVTSK